MEKSITKKQTHTCDYLCDFPIGVSVATDKRNDRNKNKHWTMGEVGVAVDS